MNHCRNNFLYHLTLIALVFASSCTLRVPTNFPRDPSIDPLIIIPDFAAILGDDWHGDEIEVATVGDDVKGYTPSLVYRANQSTYHTESDFPLLRYTVLIYEDAESAFERYIIQGNMLFFDDPRDTFVYVGIPTDTMPNADEAHAACMDGSSASVGRILRCNGIFLYDRTVVVFRARSINGSVRYFPDDSVQELFRAIDDLLGD